MACMFLHKIATKRKKKKIPTNASLPSVVLLNYRDDGVTPYIIVWKHGLEAMKV